MGSHSERKSMSAALFWIGLDSVDRASMERWLGATEVCKLCITEESSEKSLRVVSEATKYKKNFERTLSEYVPRVSNGKCVGYTMIAITELERPVQRGNAE